MKKIPYPGWILFLSVMITLAPWQQLSATVKHFTDEKGTIHIDNNTEDDHKVMNKASNAPAQQKTPEVVKPPEPAPANIFPKAETAKDEEDSKSEDDDE